MQLGRSLGSADGQLAWGSIHVEGHAEKRSERQRIMHEERGFLLHTKSGRTFDVAFFLDRREKVVKSVEMPLPNLYA